MLDFKNAVSFHIFSKCALVHFYSGLKHETQGLQAEKEVHEILNYSNVVLNVPISVLFFVHNEMVAVEYT